MAKKKTTTKSSKRKSVPKSSTRSSRSSYASSPPPMYIPPPSSSSSGGMGVGMIFMIVLALLIFAGIGYVLMYPDEGQRVLNVLGFGATTKAAVRRKTDDGMSTGAIVGIVILALLVIGGIVYFFMNRGGGPIMDAPIDPDGVRESKIQNWLEANMDKEEAKNLFNEYKNIFMHGKYGDIEEWFNDLQDRVTRDKPGVQTRIMLTEMKNEASMAKAAKKV